ncbi:MAG: 4Fe-4S binding protein [bacterium]
MSIEEYVFLSGKGGSGKTTVCAAWADLNRPIGSGAGTVMVDADVDAANLAIVGEVRKTEEHPFTGSALPVLIGEACSGCGLCEEVCRFDAVRMREDGQGRGPIPDIDPFLCEGCGACMEACPCGALEMEPQRVGTWFRSESRFGPLFGAELLPGAENSGKLVARIRQEARRWARDGGYRLLLTDGPPGIGCPVISALSGAAGIIAVAEAGETGRSDLRRLLTLAHRFELPVQLIINKADIHPGAAAAIESMGRGEGVDLLGRIPYDPAVVHRMVEGVPVTSDAASPAAAALRSIHGRWSEGRSPLYRVATPS